MCEKKFTSYSSHCNLTSYLGLFKILCVPLEKSRLRLCDWQVCMHENLVFVFWPPWDTQIDFYISSWSENLLVCCSESISNPRFMPRPRGIESFLTKTYFPQVNKQLEHIQPFSGRKHILDLGINLFWWPIDFKGILSTLSLACKLPRAFCVFLTTATILYFITPPMK